jgi:hypothetical protein
MTYRVGQKVECIRHCGPTTWRAWLTRIAHPIRGALPIKGRVYEIENITPLDQLELVGLHSPACNYWAAGFNPVFFRPIVERETDIGFAHEILRKASRTKETAASGRARDRAICPAVARFNEGRVA